MRGAFLALFCLLLASVHTQAETVVLDDSASPRQQASAIFEWVVERLDASAATDHLYEQRALVSGLEYRLDTARFVGLPVRIYLHFPRNTPGLDQGGAARLSWRTRRGVLTAGAAAQGERALVFDGVVESPLIGETLDFTILLDVRDITGPFRLAPRFVLETQ